MSPGFLLFQAEDVMENLKVRRVRRADLPVLLGMVQALALHHGDQSVVTLGALARDLLGRAPWARGLVASAGTKLLGYAILAPLLRAQYGQRGMDLHHLYVVEPARGQGAGRALIAAAQAEARDAGAAYLSVGTHPANHAAAAAYLACDFTQVPVAGLRFTMAIEPGRVG